MVGLSQRGWMPGPDLPVDLGNGCVFTLPMQVRWLPMEARENVARIEFRLADSFDPETLAAALRTGTEAPS